MISKLMIITAKIILNHIANLKKNSLANAPAIPSFAVSINVLDSKSRLFSVKTTVLAVIVIINLTYFCYFVKYILLWDYK